MRDLEHFSLPFKTSGAKHSAAQIFFCRYCQIIVIILIVLLLAQIIVLFKRHFQRTQSRVHLHETKNLTTDYLTA